MTSTLFESFMVFYLLEVLILGFIGFNILREIKKEEVSSSGGETNASGPSPSDIIKMRAIAKEMQRQNK